MSTPGAPNIFRQPRSRNQSLEFRWNPPTSDGGSPILGYRLQLNAETPIEVNSSTFYYQVTGLTNGTDYLTAIDASNANGYGDKAYFRTFQPGSAKPGAPATASASTVGTSSAIVSWTPPAVTPDSAIQWYTIYSQSSSGSDPVLKATADGLTQSSYFFGNLNPVSSYSFKVYGVNCPGWGPPSTTATVSFVPASDYVFEATFDTTANTTGFSNYDSNRLFVNSQTGSGYSYLTTWNYTGSNNLYKTYTSTTTNTVSYVCSVYRAAAATQYTGIMMSRAPNGNGLNMFDSTNLSYIWANATSLNTNITLPLNEWVHLALTITSSNAKWYVNGELAYTNTTSHAAQVMSDVYIGTDSAVASTRTFPGYIDNIRFYTRTLSDSEVYNIYKYYQAPQTSTAVPTTITGLQAWYDGADPLGTGTPPSSGAVVSTWSDKSGNARNATGVGSPTYTSGNFGRISLNGSSQYYNLSTGSFIANQNFTIFIVERLQATATASPFIGGTTLSLNANLVCYYYNANATAMDFNYFGNNVTTTSVRAFNIAAAQPIRIWTFRQIASQRSIWLNGIPAVQDTNNTLISAWAGAAIGFYNANYYNGQMLDVLFYTGTISIDNMQKVLAYLAAKWYVSVPAFLPPKVTGLVLWLDADDASSFTLSGSNVTQWRDKSGTGNHFSVSSGTPTRITDGSRTVVDFTGTAIMAGTSSISFTTSFSIFVVTRVTGANSNGVANFLDVSTKSIRYASAASLSTIQLNGGPSSTPNADDLVSVFQVNGDSTRPATASSVYTAYHMFDGSPQASASGTPTLSSSFNSRYFTGRICEILVFNTAMINLNRQKVQGYLAWKWGLQGLLPSAHTYYAVKPSA